MIPRNIFQTSDHLDDPLIQENILTLKSRSAGFNYKHFSSTECEKYITSNYPRSVVRNYLRINPLYAAARADLFRYLLMYREGGIYLDIKSNLQYDANTITQLGKYILGKWSNDSKKNYNDEFQQFNIITPQNNPILKDVISEVLKNIDMYDKSIVGRQAVLNTTGPKAYTRAIQNSTFYQNNKSYYVISTHKQIGIIYNNLPKLYRNKPDYRCLREPLVQY